MRAFRPPRDQCLSELVQPCAETTWRARGEFLCGGTNSSNPSSSSGESTANPFEPEDVGRAINLSYVLRGAGGSWR